MHELATLLTSPGRRTVCQHQTMAHPPRFHDDDPLLNRVRDLALTFPGAAEKISHGTPTFYTVKVFCQYGAPVKGDHDSWALRRALVFRPDESERALLQADARIHIPAYAGPYGWLALDLTQGEPDWAEVRELMDASYRLTAPTKRIAELDAR